MRVSDQVYVQRPLKYEKFSMEREKRAQQSKIIFKDRNPFKVMTVCDEVIMFEQSGMHPLS